jgi:hypothetical protein
MCNSVQRVVSVVRHEITCGLLGLDGEPDESPENSYAEVRALFRRDDLRGSTSHDVRTKPLSQHVEIAN